MVEEAAYIDQNSIKNIRKRNIQAVLGLLKIKTVDTSGETRVRMQKNAFQRNVLKDVFKITRFPSKQTRDDLALLLNHTNRGIQIWFQNQRNSKEERADEEGENQLLENDTPNTEPVRDGIYKRKKPKDGSHKKATVDILTLVDIIESHIPMDKREKWENFINHVPHFY